MLKKSVRRGAAALTAVLIVAGLSFSAEAGQTGNPNPGTAADNSEIGMLKQRLDAQERVINNLLRQSDPFFAAPGGTADFWMPVPDLRMDFGGFPVPVKSDVFGRMNVSDQKDKIEVSVEMPGMEKGDINIEVKNDVLTISGEKKHAQEVKEVDYYMQERQFGTFKRAIQLPPDADVDKISSSLNNGVLTILIPKEAAKSQQVKKIPVK